MKHLVDKEAPCEMDSKQALSFFLLLSVGIPDKQEETPEFIVIHSDRQVQLR